MKTKPEERTRDPTKGTIAAIASYRESRGMRTFDRRALHVARSLPSPSLFLHSLSASERAKE